MDLKRPRLNPFLLRSFGVRLDGNLRGRVGKGLVDVQNGAVKLRDSCDERLAVEAELHAHEVLDDAGVA